MAGIIAFTGAGISVASGLPTFDFHWHGIPARELLTLSAFQRDPDQFFDFFRDALATWGKASPNEAHLAIALAKIPVITQNIDGLHQRAGSATVCELHGNLRSMVCPACRRRAPLALPESGPPHCHCGGIFKPDVVLFEEPLQDWEEAMALLAGATHVLVVGTSLAVAPACYIPNLAARQGANIEILNDDAARDVPAAIERLRQEGVILPG